MLCVPMPPLLTCTLWGRRGRQQWRLSKGQGESMAGNGWHLVGARAGEGATGLLLESQTMLGRSPRNPIWAIGPRLSIFRVRSLPTRPGPGPRSPPGARLQAEGLGPGAAPPSELRESFLGDAAVGSPRAFWGARTGEGRPCTAGGRRAAWAAPPPLRFPFLCSASSPGPALRRPFVCAGRPVVIFRRQVWEPQLAGSLAGHRPRHPRDARAL